jgi:UbiD family decarboxylase
MDPAPYIDMTPVMKDPDSGFYNAAFLRNMVKGPRRLGIHMSPRHNWQIHRKNEEQKRNTPVAIVVSHHPAFYLGALNVSPFGVDDYSRIGAIRGEPLRLTASETWGEDFLGAATRRSSSRGCACRCPEVGAVRRVHRLLWPAAGARSSR